jgi:hypothetical protein
MNPGTHCFKTIAAAFVVLLIWSDRVVLAEVKVDKVSCVGLVNCLRLANDEVEVVVTTDVGPRIIRYAFVGGGQNLLAVMPVTLDERSRNEWQPWGGHRLWLAPEAKPWSYAPDNSPIQHERQDDRTIRLRRGVETETGIEKEIVVALDAKGSGVTITHRLTNRNAKAVDLAPWALTIMASGGTVILPQEPYRSHDDELLPVRPLALWGYTDLSDPRWQIGPKYIRLSTDSTLKAPQKIGVGNRQGWAAYARRGQLFVKRIAPRDGATYPDFGSNFEAYTSSDFIELESLGPLTSLAPGATVEHVERWYLFKDVHVGDDEASVEKALAPVLTKAAAP